jgi:acetolactate synthase-1/2/3 large subunit
VSEAKAAHDQYLQTFWAPRSASSVLPAHVVKTVRDAFPADTIVTHGAGNHSSYTMRLAAQCPRAFLKAMGTATMGYAFPAALGAKLARPEAPVLAIVGDGDFMMASQDLETAVRENLSVAVLILNNFSYLAESIQAGKGKIDHAFQAANHGNPDFVQFAESFGALGRRLDAPDQVAEVARWAAAQLKPVLIDAIVDRDAMPALLG